MPAPKKTNKKRQASICLTPSVIPVFTHLAAQEGISRSLMIEQLAIDAVLSSKEHTQHLTEEEIDLLRTMQKMAAYSKGA